MEQNDKRPGFMLCIIMFTIFMVSIFFILSMLPSCTSSITMVHTEGKASDVVDETETNKANVSLSVPIEEIL